MDREEMFERFKRFVLEYEEKGVKKYLSEISDMVSNSSRDSIVVEYSDIVLFDSELSDIVTNDYDEFVEVFKDVVIDVVKEYYDIDLSSNFYVRVRGLNKSLLIKDIMDGEINRLVQFDGVLNSVSDPYYVLRKGVWVCKDCGHEEVRFFDIIYGGDVPKRCSECGSSNLKFDIKKSDFYVVKRIEVQDIPEVVGDNVSVVSGYVVGKDLTSMISPGDRVTITGVVRPKPINKSMRSFNRVIEVSDIVNKSQKFSDIEISREEERKIKEIAERKDIVEYLVQSFAPSIKGQYDMKFAMLISLFSGGDIITPDGMHVRGESHTLIVGDPGTSKSQSIEFLKQVIPRGGVTSATTSTGVGLTVTAERDSERGTWIIKAGFLPKAHNGIAVIDEFAELSNKDKEALREVMEQGTISTSKASVSIVLPARTTIIALMNPKYGRWNLEERFYDQIDLSPPLLSRFDLIIPVVDRPDKDKDYDIAKHILSFMINGKVPRGTDFMKPELMKKYIAYARQNIDPKLTDDVIEYLSKYYSEKRSKYRMRDGFIETPLTARQLLAFYRMARAVARMRLSNVITIDDVKLVIEFWEKNMMRLFSVEDDEELVDINEVEIGTSSKTLSKVEKIIKIIKSLEPDHEDGVPLRDILEEAHKMGIEKNEAKKLIQELYKKGDIYEPTYGKFKVY